ncbi:MAG: S8 family serine peptidase [Paludibacteraceae bacterium]
MLNKIRINRLGYADLIVPDSVNIEKYVNSLERSDNFEIVEYNNFGHYCFIPNDTERSGQWYLSNINIYSAWNITMGNSKTTVAILDSGTDWRHIDIGNGIDGNSNINEKLAWNYITNRNDVITENRHGTMVAGIVGAKSNNIRGISGISGGNNNSGITMIPFCVGVDSPDASIIDDAIIDAVDLGAKIIQLSLSVGQTNAINAAIEYATQNNVLIVCASGNDNFTAVNYPASHPNVLAVGGTNNSNKRASFSNYGNLLDIVAPAENIYSTDLDDSYSFDSGTSFAAPQITGIAALVFTVRPDLTGQQVKDVIEQTARKVGGYSYISNPDRPNGTWNTEMGYGLVDAYNALYSISPRISGPATICTQATYTIENLPSGATVAWSASNNYITLVWANNETAVFQKNGVWNSSILATIHINGTQLTLSPFEIIVDKPVMTILDSSSPNVEVEHPACCATAYLSGYYDEAYVDLAIVGLDNLSISNFDVENNNSIFSVHRDSRGVSIVSHANQGSGCFKIHPKNECGYGQPISVCVEIGTGGYFSLTPNPASSVVTLRLNKADTKSPKNIVSRKPIRYEIQLLSTFGLIKTIQTDQSEVQIPINGLAKGVYYVHVIRSGNVEKKKLVVE